MESLRIQRRAAARKRRSILAVLGAVLVAAVGTSALMASAETLDLTKEQMIEQLTAVADSAGGDVAKHLDKAVEALEKGLDEASKGKPEKAFKEDATAIKELLKIDGHTEFVAPIIERIVAIDEQAAQAKIDEATAAGADVSKPLEKMAKAGDELADGKPDKAVEQYGKAYEYAEKAFEKAAKETEEAAGASAAGPAVDGLPVGKYSLYDVVFVRADTVGDPEPVFIRVTGTNAPGTMGDTGTGNEGFIYSEAFGPGDTFMNQPGIMQLHVSCSDAFPGGIGAKSDPQPESHWLINTIQILKIKDGMVERECGVVGAGLPEPPEIPEYPEAPDYPDEPEIPIIWEV